MDDDYDDLSHRIHDLSIPNLLVVTNTTFEILQIMLKLKIFEKYSFQGGDTGVVELGGKFREGTPCDWDFNEKVVNR